MRFRRLVVFGFHTPGGAIDFRGTAVDSGGPGFPVSDVAGSPSSASPPAGASTAACTTKDLRTHLGSAQGAAGSVYQVIDFTNISTSACTLYGYPGVAMTRGKTPGTQIGQAASRSSAAAARLVTLHPGGTASAVLRIAQAGDYPAAKCRPVASSYLQIIPPGQRTPLYLPYKSTGCSATAVNQLTIRVVRAGSGS
jgi:uncharacterized protein DUF4232